VPRDMAISEKREATDDRRRGCVGQRSEAKVENLEFLTQRVIA
jgi:hypothetical protein